MVLIAELRIMFNILAINKYSHLPNAFIRVTIQRTFYPQSLPVNKILIMESRRDVMIIAYPLCKYCQPHRGGIVSLIL